MQTTRRRRAHGLADMSCALALFAAAAACPAAQGVALQAGSRGSVDSVGVQWLLPVWYRTEWKNWRIAGHPELQLNRHRSHSDEAVQAGAFATFRISPIRTGAYPYLEAGLGLNLFSEEKLGRRNLSTHFQFGELIGVGIAWGGRAGGKGETSVGVRLSHYSNAGLKQPNHGIEVFQLTVSHRF
uniref:Lipid A deacylase n=2 Tax=Aromatoleum anaerobium TaxID=182180 RepID=A0ABX1PLM1_9RHOO